ncbi:hypothetical protein SVI_2105 [Shewanella violacea DSS12]|uniref:Uncharacterized protein n=1 Tax=Shewanella violacea (strain JCM 10179 / CIP 106290 / LMG 19151 / DSS12) TaxID=637905 RepID=D4ZK77_SHEVD|nr:hypothetical protein SVI_2105 [Shewanella violacea DSS12]
MEDALNIFEEYACGGLEYLDEVIDRANCKESIQQQIQDLDGDHLTDDITNLFQQNIRSKTLTEINIISVRLSR